MVRLSDELNHPIPIIYSDYRTNCFITRTDAGIDKNTKTSEGCRMFSLHVAMAMVVLTVIQVRSAMKSGRTNDWLLAVWYAFLVGVNLMFGLYQLFK